MLGLQLKGPYGVGINGFFYDLGGSQGVDCGIYRRLADIYGLPKRATLEARRLRPLLENLGDQCGMRPAHFGRVNLREVVRPELAIAFAVNRARDEDAGAGVSRT